MVDILKTVDPGITDEFIKSKLDGTSKYSVIKANITPEIFNKIDALGAPSSTVRRSPSACTPTVVWVAPWSANTTLLKRLTANGKGGTVSR